METLKLGSLLNRHSHEAVFIGMPGRDVVPAPRAGVPRQLHQGRAAAEQLAAGQPAGLPGRAGPAAARHLARVKRACHVLC